MAGTAFTGRVYDCGYLPVGGGHQLYYERSGTPGGVPILFVHGGPGACCTDQDKRFFDPDLTDVLFFDQRGAGKSTPFCSLEANTTRDLVGDMVALLNHFGIERAVLFGGSWGSTLSLVFCIHHPDRVMGMVLRGIFLGDRQSVRHYTRGGVKPHCPEAWERFIGQVPRGHRRNPVAYYLDGMLSADQAVRERCLYEWAYYEISISKLKISHRQIETVMEKIAYRATSLLEAFYIEHGLFLPDRFILRNSRRVPDIPVSIIHGRYDMICPPEQAYRLHRKLPRSILYLPCAGHSGSEPAIADKLVSETARICRLLDSCTNLRTVK